MKVLIACEFSGIVREAFKSLGHNAWSCDISPTEIPGQHFEYDVRELDLTSFDLMIAHPPCTYLANSGVQHLYKDDSRWGELDKACEFFNWLLDIDIPSVIENPIPHRWAAEQMHRSYDQIIQPYDHGEPWSKRTCLWLNQVPLLQPREYIEPWWWNGRKLTWPSYGWHDPISDHRSKDRSRTLPGVALSLAEQYGGFK